MSSPQTIEIVKTCIATALGGGLALFGVYLTSHFDAKKRRDEMLRGRGEELYVLCDKWMNGLFAYALRLSSVMQGKLTYNQALDLEIAEGKERSLDFVRIEMLIDVYFPSVRPAYDSAAKVRDSLNVIANEHKRAYSQGDVDGTPYLEPFLKEMRRIDSASAALKGAVIQGLRSI